VAARILDDFRAFAWPRGPVTASIGVAEARRDDTPDDLVQRADAALYQAKRAGRNQMAEAKT
jgi:diguanylate cyclase (GGDEF)-like protein